MTCYQGIWKWEASWSWPNVWQIIWTLLGWSHQPSWEWLPSNGRQPSRWSGPCVAPSTAWYLQHDTFSILVQWPKVHGRQMWSDLRAVNHKMAFNSWSLGIARSAAMQMQPQGLLASLGLASLPDARLLILTFAIWSRRPSYKTTQLMNYEEKLLEQAMLKWKSLWGTSICILWRICTTLSFKDASLTQKLSDIKLTGRPNSPDCSCTLAEAL